MTGEDDRRGRAGDRRRRGLRPRLDAGLDWDADRLRVRELALQAPTGVLRGAGELRFGGEELRFDLAAERLDLAAAPWQELTGGRLSGQAALTAELTGTLAAPRLVVDASLADLELPGAGIGKGPTPATAGVVGAPPLRFAGALHAELADRELRATLDLPGLVALTGGGSGSVAGERARICASA